MHLSPSGAQVGEGGLLGFLDSEKNNLALLIKLECVLEGHLPDSSRRRS